MIRSWLAGLFLALSLSLGAVHPAVALPAWQIVALAPSLTPETKAYAQACTGITSSFQRAVDGFVRTVKPSGAFSKLDTLTLADAPTSACGLINLISPTTTWAINGSPTFTAFRGFTGDASAAYLQYPTNYSALAHYSQNDASIFVYADTAAASTSKEIGSASGTSVYISAYNSSGNGIQFRINSATVTNSAVVSTGIGCTLAQRADSANQAVYRDGALVLFGAATSAAVSASAPVIFQGGGSTFSSRRIKAFGVGASLTTSQIATLCAAIVTFANAIGDPL